MASRIDSKRSKSPARPAAILAITVSPAPETSKTSFALVGKSALLIFLFLLLIFLTSCQSTANKDDLIRDSEDQNSQQINEAKSKIEVRYSCGEDGVSEFLNDGWIITEEYTEEKICTWKSFPATKDCDMEKDKGCKITTPDKIGEEKIYLLEK